MKSNIIQLAIINQIKIENSTCLLKFFTQKCKALYMERTTNSSNNTPYRLTALVGSIRRLDLDFGVKVTSLPYISYQPFLHVTLTLHSKVTDCCIFSRIYSSYCGS